MELPEIKKSKHPCAVCAKRKVKCDRLIPCTNCVKRGFEKECLERSAEEKAESAVLQFWQSYEHWVADIGLFKSQDLDQGHYNARVDLKQDIDDCWYWFEFLGHERAYKLLDYSIERLGCLFFGYFSDIGDLYIRLDECWAAFADANTHRFDLTVDDHYTSALLWSIFSLAVYYMPLELLSQIFPEKPQRDSFKTNESESNEWTEMTQLELYQCLANCAVVGLHEAKLLTNPDIRLLQVYLILCSTAYPYREVSTSNSLLSLCFSAAKLFHVDDSRPLLSDSTAMRLTKMTCEKIWYSLCSWDYLQSGPRKSTVFHTEISSLLQHAAYLEDLPNIDVYQSEDSFEALYWKLLSLDRDLDQYLTKDTKPPLKTLDAIKRQIDIFTRKATSTEDSPSIASDFAKFLVSFLLNTLAWKLHKMYYIFFDISNSLVKSIHYTKSLIALIVKNIKNQRNIIFNKHPIVVCCFARVATFYAFCEIIFGSEKLRDLNLDISEVLANLSPVLEPHLSGLVYLVARFNLLKTFWEERYSEPFSFIPGHYFMTVLQNDINVFSRQALVRPSMVMGPERMLMKRRASDDQLSYKDNSNVFRSVVAKFESEYSIDYLTRRRTDDGNY